MNEDLFSRKVAAFLHDPVDKPFILMQGISHERRASELSDKLGVRVEGVDAADHIASAMERAFIPKGASRNEALQVRFLDDPCVKHPLSGRELEGSERLKGTQPHHFIETADKAFAEIAGRPHADDKLLFLDLWRNLKPLVVKHGGERLGRFWSLAPADTRMPDHSIFEHGKIASACCRSGYANNLLLSKCSLMLFSIGGVQQFISEARKAQDLFWGSFILSYLNWKVIERISEEYGPDCLVFPDIHGQPFADMWLGKKGVRVDADDNTIQDIGIPTIPNRALAIIPETEAEALQALGEELDESVREELKAMGENVLRGLQIREAPQGFDEQLGKALSTHWVFLPWFSDKNELKAWKAALESVREHLKPESMDAIDEALRIVEAKGEYAPNIGNAYSLLYSFCEMSAGSMKNLNDFEQLEERGRKCSLCGIRNVLFYKKSSGEEGHEDARIKSSKLFNRDAVIFSASDTVITLKLLQPGEGLCAMCFCKRCAEKHFEQELKDAAEKGLFPKFPSIAEVALRKTMKKLEGVQGYEDYRRLFGSDYDPQLLYEENLTERFFEKNGLDTSKLSIASDLLKRLLDKSGLRPSKYYAVVKVDGDDMGKWLSGQLGPNYEEIYHPSVWKALDEDFKADLQGKRRLLTPAMHATISSALKDYSRVLVKELVLNKHDGFLIYAGGDDALILVNLEDLLELAARLRASFSGHIDGSLEEVDFSRDASGFIEWKDGFLTTMGPKASLSMGICISHYRTPLGMVLETAREAEEKAKSLPGKNAFCITVLKGSGERLETLWKWFYRDSEKELGKGGTAILIKELVDSLKGTESTTGSGFSDRFVYKLKETFRRFDPAEPIPHMDDMIQSETRRLLSRSYASKSGDEGLRRQMIEDWSSRIKSLYLNSRNLGNFMSLLETAAFLAREP